MKTILHSKWLPISILFIFSVVGIHILLTIFMK